MARIGLPSFLTRLGLRNADDTGSVSLQSPAGQSTDITLTLPGTIPPVSRAITVSSSGIMSYTTIPSTVLYNFSNVDYSIPADASIVRQTGTLTAHRTVTLPSPESVEVGKQITIQNVGQTYAGCLDIIISPGTGNVINSQAASGTFTFPWACNTVVVTRMDFSTTGTHWGASGVRMPHSSSGSINYDPRFVTAANTFWASDTYGANNVGTGNIVRVSSTAAFLNLETGTQATGRAGFRTNSFMSTTQSSFAARFRASITTESNDTNNFFAVFGFSSAPTNSNPTTGIYWYYNHAVNSGNLQGYVNNDSTASTVDSAVSPVGSSFQDMGIYYNLAANEVRFFLNGAQEGSAITSPIPTDNISFDFRIHKTASTSNRTMRISRAALWVPTPTIVI